LLFSSLLYFIILIVLLPCNREVPSRCPEEPAEELSTRALMGGPQLGHHTPYLLLPPHGRVRTP